MQSAYISLLKRAASLNLSMFVDFGEGDGEHCGTSWKRAADACKACDMVNVVFRDTEGARRGVAAIIAVGMDPEETVCDYTCGPTSAWLDDWSADYLSAAGISPHY